MITLNNQAKAFVHMRILLLISAVVLFIIAINWPKIVATKEHKNAQQPKKETISFWQSENFSVPHTNAPRFDLNDALLTGMRIGVHLIEYGGTINDIDYFEDCIRTNNSDAVRNWFIEHGAKIPFKN